MGGNAASARMKAGGGEEGREEMRRGEGEGEGAGAGEGAGGEEGRKGRKGEPFLGAPNLHHHRINI